MIFQKYLLDASYFRDLHFSCQQYLHSLNLGEFLPVGQEQLHVIAVLVLQEVLEAVFHPELLALVREQTHVDDREHILCPLYLHRTSVDNDEVLLRHGAKLERDPLGQLPRHRVLNEPGLMDVLAVLDEV